MNKIAFSCVVPSDESLGTAFLAQLKDAGFDGVEPTFWQENSLPNNSDPRRTAEKLAAMAQRAGLAVPSMRGGPLFWGLFASTDSANRASAVEVASRAMEAVKIMGGDTLLVVPGRWEAANTHEQTWNSALDTARRIADAATKSGIDVALENVENKFLLSPREWIAFLDAVGSPNVRMYFDAGNITYMRTGFPEQWIRQLGRKYIRRVHFKDATDDSRITYLLEGSVNWPGVTAALREIGYDDWIGIELNLPTHHPAAMLAGTCRAARAILSS
jgi:hexulose-6-phosphate isomerase